jgi:hypothetical protein
VKPDEVLGYAAGVLAILGVLLLVALQPALLIPVFGGVVLGGLVAFPTIRRRGARGAHAAAPAAEAAHPLPAAVAARRSHVPMIVGVAAALILVAIVAAVALLSSGQKAVAPFPTPTVTPTPTPNASERFPSVRGIRYAATVTLVDEPRRFRVHEVIRLPGDLLESSSAGESGPQVGDEWEFQGARGERSEQYVYTRDRNIPIDTAGLPDVLRKNSIGLAQIVLPGSRTTLVPRDGSLVELRVPRRFIYGTDPEAKRRRYGGNEILTVKLEGLEDSPERRAVEVEVANWLGRRALYQRIQSSTLWGSVWWLIGPLIALIVAYFVQRWLKEHFPEPAAGPA